MAVDSKDFEHITRNAAEKHAQQTFDDLQREIRGVDSGRHARFGHKDGANGAAAQRRKAQTQASVTALDMLLQSNPEYAALYQKTIDLLDHAETATEQALEQAQHDLVQAEGALKETLDSANKLPDGTAIFKDDDGQVWAEDGRLVEAEELESVVWNEGAPSYAEYRQRKQAVEAHRLRIEDLRRYQVDVLGNARDKLQDKQNPLSPDELKKVHDDILTKADSYVSQVIQPETDEANAEGHIDIGMKTPKIDTF